MTDFPFNLKIKTNGVYESVTCTAELRTIAGKREVYEALWNNQSVIVKLFLNKIMGRFTLKKEWRGINTLQKLELNSPKPLFCGRTEDGKWVTVVEKINDAVTALHIFNEASERPKKISLLSQVCKELAKQHNKGVEQKDLHLGNFLIAGERVFSLDTAEIKFHTSPLPREQSIAQLALFACYLPLNDTTSITEFCSEYFAERGWKFEKADLELLLKKAKLLKQRGIEKWLKKSLRTGTKYLKIKVENCTAIFDRTFCGQEKMREFIGQIDALMDSGQTLKNGNTCYVSLATWNGRKIVIKRYNHKGIAHSLCQTIKGSRAKRNWLNGYRLILLNIATPRPLACIERSGGKILHSSYIVTEYADGLKLHDFLENAEILEAEKIEIIQKITETLSKLAANNISHGDLKHSNILVLDSRPVLTDLDAMQVNRIKWLAQYRAARDMEKFINGTRGNYDIANFL